MLSDLKWPIFHASGHTTSKEYKVGSSEGIHYIFQNLIWSLKFRLCVIYFRMIIHNWLNEVLLIMLLPVPIYLVRYKYQEAERQFILS